MMNARSRTLRLAAALLATGALVTGLAAPALAEGGAQPATDPSFRSFFELAPAAVDEHSADAQFMQIPAGSYSAVTQNGLYVQAVNDGGRTSLETVGSTDSLVTSRIDLSDVLSRIDAVALVDEGDGALVAYVRGLAGETTALVRVASPESTTWDGSQIATITELDGFHPERLRLLGDIGSGLVGVAPNADGALVAQRYAYDLTPNTARPAVELPLNPGAQLSFDANWGNFYAAGAGVLERVSLYDASTVQTAALPGMGQITRVVPSASHVLVSDDAGRVAVLDNASFELVSSIALPGPAGSVVVGEKTAEVIATAADGSAMWRYGFDGTPHQAIDLGGASVQHGSLHAASSYDTTYTFAGSVEGQSFRYVAQYLEPYRISYLGELRAEERGGAVELSFASLGAQAPDDSVDYAWEYSLDGGAHWAGRTQSWDQARAAERTAVHPRPELPPAIGPARAARTDVSADGPLATSGYSATESSVTLPEHAQDALWRVKLTNGYGTTVSEARTVSWGPSEAGEPASFTRHPSPVQVAAGSPAVFSVAVAGTPEPVVSWQIKRPGGEWEDLDASGAELTIPAATTADDGARLRAVAVQGERRVESNPATLTVLSEAAAELGAAPAGAVTIADARMRWELNQYSRDWKREASGGVELAGDHGFDFTGGVGWFDARTGAAQLSWSGVADYRPYGGMNGLKLSFANMYLAVDASGQATLTAELFWNNGGGAGGAGSSGESDGRTRVVIATFAEAGLTRSPAAIALQATPEWDHRSYLAPGLGDATVYPSSFPASFLDHLDSGLRPWFLPTGNQDVRKQGTEVTVSGTLTTRPARTTGDRIDALDPLGDGAQHFADSAPRIVAQPADVRAAAGGSATVAAAAVGHPAPTVQWQREVAGAWADIEGASSPALELTELREGTFVVRAVFRNAMGTAVSDSARVQVADPSEPGPAPEQPAEPGSGGEPGAESGAEGTGPAATADPAQAAQGSVPGAAVTGAQLAATGAGAPWLWAGSGAILLLLCGAVLVARRRLKVPGR